MVISVSIAFTGLVPIVPVVVVEISRLVAMISTTLLSPWVIFPEAFNVTLPEPASIKPTFTAPILVTTTDPLPVVVSAFKLVVALVISRALAPPTPVNPSALSVIVAASISAVPLAACWATISPTASSVILPVVCNVLEAPLNTMLLLPLVVARVTLSSAVAAAADPNNTEPPTRILLFILRIWTVWADDVSVNTVKSAVCRAPFVSST